MAEVIAQRRAEMQISRSGLVCAVGRNSLQTAILLRAGHTELRATPFSSGYHTLRMCQLWDFPQDCVGFERLLRLAVPALHQVMAEPGDTESEAPAVGRAGGGAKANRTTTPLSQQAVPLLLSLPPEGRADDDEDAAERFAALLSEAAGLRVDPNHSVTMRGGHTSGARLLERAMDLIDRGDAERVVVGGVDGYFHPDLLRALDDDDQLFGTDTPRGFLPGEAAAFLLVERPTHPPAPRADESGDDPDGAERPAVRLCWAAGERIPDEVLAAMLEEDEEDEEDEPKEAPARTSSNSATARAARRAQTRMRLALSRLTGGGGRARAWWRRRRARRAREREEAAQEELPDLAATMIELLKKAAQARSDLPQHWVLTDTNHASERTEQWSTAMIEALPTEVHCDHPMQQIGDAGAASVPVLVALACAQWQLRSAPAANALIATHANDGDRAVVLLREPT